MGQSLSKVTRRGPSSVFSNIVAKFENAMKRDALQDIQRKEALAKAAGSKYSDPNASEAGFTRGSSFEARHQPQHQEMPEDLLKFLKDLGPVQQSVNVGMTTSPETTEPQEGGKNQRVRRVMRIIEQDERNDGSIDDKNSHSVIPGMTTTRTTNFSTTEPQKIDPTELRLNDGEFYRLLLDFQSQHRRNHGDGNGTGNIGNDAKKKSCAENDTTVEANIVAEKFASSYVQKRKLMPDNTTLLKNAILYTGIPTLMKDVTDNNSIVGAWPHKITELKMLKLELLEKNETQLRIETEGIEVTAKNNKK